MQAMNGDVCSVMQKYIDRGFVERVLQIVQREVEGGTETGTEFVMLYGFKPKRKGDPIMIFSHCPGCGSEQKDKVGLECKP